MTENNENIINNDDPNKDSDVISEAFDNQNIENNIDEDFFDQDDPNKDSDILSEAFDNQNIENNIDENSYNENENDDDAAADDDDDDQVLNTDAADAADADDENLSSLKKDKKNNSYFKNIELLLDIDMDMAVEIGQSRMQIDEVLNLTTGSIVELNHLNGEYVDIMVNNKLIAKGELVSIDDNFGVRIINIIEKNERLKLYNN